MNVSWFVVDDVTCEVKLVEATVVESEAEVDESKAFVLL